MLEPVEATVELRVREHRLDQFLAFSVERLPSSDSSTERMNA
jgi:hypothetical protein